jgi:hypothetical protein
VLHVDLAPLFPLARESIYTHGTKEQWLKWKVACEFPASSIIIILFIYLQLLFIYFIVNYYLFIIVVPRTTLNRRACWAVSR